MLFKTISASLFLFATVNSLITATPAKASNTIQNTEVAARDIIPDNSLQEKRFICRGCNENENAALAYFQDVGVSDKNALATIMANIRQESMFVPNICEGGSIVPYHNCRRGGYGLIQFTASSRYYGLGSFSKQTNGDPSSLETQLKYITTEPEWKQVEDRFKQPGKSISQYMKYAFRWLGWGIKGPRTSYAYDYVNRLVIQETQPDS